MKQSDFRIHGNFTKIPQSILHDSRLSAQALGIYVMIVNFFVIEGFVIYKSMLMRRFSNGTASFNRGWNELKAYGYLSMEKKHVNGRYAYEYELFEFPFDQRPDSQQKKEKDLSINGINDTLQEEPAAEKSAPVKAQQIEKKKQPEMKRKPVEEKKPEKKRRQEWTLHLSACPDKVRKEDDMDRNVTVSKENFASHTIKFPPNNDSVQDDNRIMIEEINDQIEYNVLAYREGEDFAKEIAALMQDVYNAPNGKTFRIGGVNVPAASVKERFKELNCDMVQSVLIQFKQYAQRIRNIHAYMLTALYNQPTIHHLSTHNEDTYLTIDMLDDDFDFLKHGTIA